jgi:hypothetical protein
VHKIISSGIDQTKPNFVVDVQAAASITLGAGNIAIYIGTTALGRNISECVSALQNCRDALREAQYPDGTLAFDSAKMVDVPEGAIVIANGAAVPLDTTENGVLIAYHNDFYEAGNSTKYTNVINRMIETFLERVVKANSTGIHAFASGVLTGTTIAAADTVTIGGRVYTFEAAPVAADDIDVGADDEESLDNLIAAINAAAGEGTKYGTGTVINPDVRAAAGAGDTMDVIARVSGTGGNAITTTAVLTAGDFAAATLLGGL